jgi:hypothetical protein
MIQDGLYHCEVGIPAEVAWPEVGHVLSISKHAFWAACKDCVERLLPWSLPAYMLIELEVVSGVVTKWVVRCELLPDRDLVMAITNDYIVKTVWVNRKSDRHSTLQRERYTVPQRELETA